jgi:hypothetical protein
MLRFQTLTLVDVPSYSGVIVHARTVYSRFVAPYSRLLLHERHCACFVE